MLPNWEACPFASKQGRRAEDMWVTGRSHSYLSKMYQKSRKRQVAQMSLADMLTSSLWWTSE